MNEWLNHPAVQSGLAPFLAGLIVAVLFNRIRLSGLAVLAGFCATVYLVSDFNFEFLSATKKIILTGLITGCVAPVLMILPDHWRFIRYLMGIAAGIITLWVFWPVLLQKSLSDGVLLGGSVAAFVIWLVVYNDQLSAQSVRAGAVGMGLGLGAGLCAILGASALLGQLGLSIGAAAGAYLIFQAIQNKPLSCGRIFTLPVSLLVGLLASAALILAKLPWYCLPVLAMIPAIVKLPVMEMASVRMQVMIFSLLALSLVTVSVILVWYAKGIIPL